MSIETCARSSLKVLKIDENQEMVGSMKTTKKDPKLSVADAGSAFKPAAMTKRRRKKVTVRMGKDYVEYLEKHPPPPPYKPVRLEFWLLSDMQDSYVAQQKAEREERERIIKQYKDQGYATREVEVSDDDEDEEL